MATPPVSRDLTRSVLAILLLGLLIGGSFWILQPFLPALVWATMIVVATWPVLRIVQARLGGRRIWAVVVMTLVILVIIILPVALAIVQIVDHADQITRLASEFTRSIPPPPEWVSRIPFAGARIETEWRELSVAGPSSLTERVQPYAGRIATWVAGQAGTFGLLVVHLLLTIALAAILYARGETGANAVRRFARRLAGDRGHHTVELAGAAIRAVALGIVVTAFVQSVLGGIGLAIAGVPYVAVLTAVMFMLCLAQLGPTLVLAPAVVWLYWTDQTAWATVLLVWTIIVGSLDNFLRPMLIQRGANLPLLLIMAGVIGGLFAFGIVGLFVGPVVLAVTYTLLKSWMDEEPDADDPRGASKPG